MSTLIIKDTQITIPKKGTISIGDLITNRDGVYPVIGFRENTYVGHDGKERTSKIVVVSNHKYGADGTYGIGESDLGSYYSVVRGHTFDEIEEISNKILGGKLSMDDLTDKEEPQDPTTTSLMVMSKDVFSAKLSEIEHMSNRVRLVQALVEQKVSEIKDQISGAVSHFSKIITRLNKIIFTLELYAGVEEDIRQLQSGSPADVEEPIYLNQLMRYMDEEVGDPSNEGISFDTIEKFDDWLLSYSKHMGCFHYELILPQKKCVRTMRVRFRAKDSHRIDLFQNSWKIEQDMQTYILIRNGENIYMIESKMDFNTKLFPDEDELSKIFSIEDEGRQFDALATYKNGLILMQGLVDRTEVFGNVRGQMSFLSTESQDSGKIKFQYEMDEKSQITDGKETLLDFMKKHPIEAGVRVLLWDTDRYHTLDDYGRGSNRFTRNYSSCYSAPNTPNEGIYKVINHISDNRPKGTLKIMYESCDRYGVERTMKIGWLVRPSDTNIVDIDSISHRNIDWINNMLYDRKLRKDYVHVMGSLMKIKEFKNEELAKEEPFVKLMMSITGRKELEVLDAVHWWKTKNKYKRPISEDDVKAIRMIKKHLKERT